MKLGLLRWLVAPSPFSRSHRLGVVWFRVVDETHDAHGDEVSYLDPMSAAGGDLRPLDADLYDRLRVMVAAGHRSVNSLAASGVLPKDTSYFDDVLDSAVLEPSERAERIVRRERWFHKAMIAVEPCSLVFLDPDDGLRRDDGVDVLADQSAAETHAYVSEVGRLLERGQSVIAYQPADRSEPVEVQAASRMDDIHEALGVDPLAAVRVRRGANQVFLVIPHPRHRSDLEDRLGALQLSRWGDELTLHRWQRNKALARTF